MAAVSKPGPRLQGRRVSFIRQNSEGYTVSQPNRGVAGRPVVVEDNVMAVGDGEGPVDGGVVGGAEGVGVHMSLSRCQLTPNTGQQERTYWYMKAWAGTCQPAQVSQRIGGPSRRRREWTVGVNAMVMVIRLVMVGVNISGNQSVISCRCLSH